MIPEAILLDKHTSFEKENCKGKLYVSKCTRNSKFWNSPTEENDTNDTRRGNISAVKSTRKKHK